MSKQDPLPLSLAAEFLGEEGLLSNILPDFTHRVGQEQMLQKVLSAFNQNEISLIEAGTGIGKSLAYLIAALKWAELTSEVVVIATHTIALQQQLIEKDLPLAMKACKSSVPVALLKGSRHYLCLRRLEDEREELTEPIIEWSKRTKTGEFSELEGKPLVDKIAVDSESCSHARCPFFSECHLYKARRYAEEAKVIITNHSLLFSDLALSLESGKNEVGTILPEYSRLILDEAHHIEEVATQYFAQKVSSNKIQQLLNGITQERGGGKLALLAQQIMKTFPILPSEHPKLKSLLDQLELYLPHQRKELGEKIFFFFREFFKLFSDEADKVRILQHHLESSSWNETLVPELEEIDKSMNEWIQAIGNLEESIAALGESSLTKKCEGILADLEGACKRLHIELEKLKMFVFTQLTTDSVRWIEKHRANIELVHAKLEIADLLHEGLFAKMDTALLCSATLATKGTFSYLKKRLGIEQAQEQIYESPYAYEENLLFCCVTDMPDPVHESFQNKATNALKLLLEKSEGQAFVLFTSYKMLQYSAECLRKSMDFPLFVQGEQERSQLLKHFRQTPHAVLLGTDSFWEGVDVAGEQLRTVIIVKLPFQAPNDPLFEAQCERIQKDGGTPFFDYALPKAVIKFKQGFGRLIRRHEDRGSVICLDPRLVQKGYGRLFKRALPQGQECIGTLQEVTDRLQQFLLLQRS